MRSSGSKIAKSVSICSEPLAENGLCTKKEDDGGGGRDELRALAASVVQNVVRLASETAEEQASNPTPYCSRAAVADDEAERLPTIHIETVPSMPSSPDWPPPPPEDIIFEEDEDQEDEDYQQNNSIPADQNDEASNAPAEIHNFATRYIDDILSKAILVAEERQKRRDEEEVREVAVRVVSDVIARANESAAERLTRGLEFPELLPTIQIDTVLSVPPSPEEDESVGGGGASAQCRAIPEITYAHCDDVEEEEEKQDEKPSSRLGKLVKHADAPEEIRDFASSFVKEIVSKALSAAEEKVVTTVPFSFGDGGEMKLNGPWYIRVRETLMRVLRSACFCTPRREDS